MKKLAALLTLALAAVALTACGGGDDSTTTTESVESSAAAGGGAGGEKSAGGGSTLSFEADPDGGLAYTSDTATAKAGEVTVEFENPQALQHDVAIEDANAEELGKTDLVSEGSASTTIKLKPGEYTFYCTVSGHRESGMEGTLTVE